MSGKLMNTESRFSKVKQLCTEYLWVIVLFAPLLVVAILVSNDFQPTTKHSSVAGTSKNGTFAITTMQLTSTELAAIVVKPLGELLLMEVYFDGVGKYVRLEADQNETYKGKVDMHQYSGKPV